MPKVTGPLHSDSAAGSIADSLTFRKTSRGHIVRKFSKPSGLPTSAQTSIRTQTGNLMKAWKLLNEEDKASWDVLANPYRIQRINAYLRYNYHRIVQGLPTTGVYPPVAPSPEYTWYSRCFSTFNDIDDLWFEEQLVFDGLVTTAASAYVSGSYFLIGGVSPNNVQFTHVRVFSNTENPSGSARITFRFFAVEDPDADLGDIAHTLLPNQWDIFELPIPLTITDVLIQNIENGDATVNIFEIELGVLS